MPITKIYNWDEHQNFIKCDKNDQFKIILYYLENFSKSGDEFFENFKKFGTTRGITTAIVDFAAHDDTILIGDYLGINLGPLPCLEIYYKNEKILKLPTSYCEEDRLEIGKFSKILEKILISIESKDGLAIVEDQKRKILENSKILPEITSMETEYSRLIYDFIDYQNNPTLNVIYYYETWSAPCMRFEGKLFKLAKKWTDTKVISSLKTKFYKINVDRLKIKALHSNLKVFPAVRIYKNGRLLQEYLEFSDNLKELEDSIDQFSS